MGCNVTNIIHILAKGDGEKASELEENKTGFKDESWITPAKPPLVPAGLHFSPGGYSRASNLGEGHHHSLVHHTFNNNNNSTEVQTPKPSLNR